MNIILDTHAFLWFVDDNPRLSDTARALIEAEDTQPFLSMASFSMLICASLISADIILLSFESIIC